MEQTLNTLIEHFVPILASVISGVLLFLIQGLSKKYGKKLDVETRQRAEDLLSSFVQQGVTLAEQWAHNRNKQLPDGERTPGQAKLEVALEYIAGEVQKNGLDQLAETQLKAKVESMLGIGTINANNLPELPLDSEEDEDDENPLGL